MQDPGPFLPGSHKGGSASRSSAHFLPPPTFERLPVGIWRKRFSYSSLNSTFSYFAKKSTRVRPEPKHQTILPLPGKCVLSSSWATVAGPRCSAPPPKNRPSGSPHAF